MSSILTARVRFSAEMGSAWPRAPGAWANVLKVWDTNSGRELLVKDLKNSVFSVAFSADGNSLTVADRSSDVQILDSGDGHVIGNCSGAVSTRTRLTLSPDGKRLVAAGHTMPLELWDTDSCRLVRMFKPGVMTVMDVAFSPDGALWPPWARTDASECGTRSATGISFRSPWPGGPVRTSAFRGMDGSP